MKKQKKEAHPGALPKLWPWLVQMHKESPAIFESEDALVSALKNGPWKRLEDKEHCPNCGESMYEYIHKLDFFNALLLKQMGDIVRMNVKKGIDFTEANRVHVVSQNFADCVRHRTTQCRTLGLIAKVENENGGHDRDKGWLITARGFAALRGEEVPAMVSVFRNKIEERFTEKTTLKDVFALYKGSDRSISSTYNSMEWVNFGDVHEGKLL